MSQFLFNTPLFINGLPVDYDIFEENGSFLFEPVFNPHFDLVAPLFIMKKEHDVYAFNGTNDDSIMAQAEEIIKEYLASN